jgi:NAD(P)-dependent dehydrogenase (short-subunit alcohol dehydrogenase family)
MQTAVKNKWALILGASSGFGEAIALSLSKIGMNIIGVHLDRKSTLPHVEEVVGQIKNNGVQAKFFNMNASDSEKRHEAIHEISGFAKEGVHCLVHSLAFGSLKPFIAMDPKDRISKEQMDMTLDVMANSLVYWTQDLVDHHLLSEGGRIFAMTSMGSHRVWSTYGAVSAAKAALESHCRQLTLELAPKKITVNAILAGVTDTPALRKIPGHERMIEIASKSNPHGRLTTPQDVAEAISLLVQPGASWITGNVLQVDGGEEITG